MKKILALAFGVLLATASFCSPPAEPAGKIDTVDHFAVNQQILELSCATIDAIVFEMPTIQMDVVYQAPVTFAFVDSYRNYNHVAGSGGSFEASNVSPAEKRLDDWYSYMKQRILYLDRYRYIKSSLYLPPPLIG